LKRRRNKRKKKERERFFTSKPGQFLLTQGVAQGFVFPQEFLIESGQGDVGKEKAELEEVSESAINKG